MPAIWKTLAAAAFLALASLIPHQAPAQTKVIIDSRPCSDPQSAGYPCPTGMTMQVEPMVPHLGTVRSAGPMTFNSNFITTYCPVSITVTQKFNLAYLTTGTEYRLERWIAGAPWQLLGTQTVRTYQDTVTTVFTFAENETYNGLLHIKTITPEHGMQPDPLIDSTRSVPFSVVCTPRPQKTNVRTVAISANPVTSSGDCPYDVHFTVTVTNDALPAGVEGDIRATLSGAGNAHPMARLMGANNTSRTYDALLRAPASQNGAMTVVVNSNNQVSASTPYHITCSNNTSEIPEKKLPPRTP